MIIQLVFISDEFIMERMMEAANMFALSPEELLIALEEEQIEVSITVTTTTNRGKRK